MALGPREMMNQRLAGQSALPVAVPSSEGLGGAFAAT